MRTLISWADDVARLGDSLGIEKFSVVDSSRCDLLLFQ